MRQQHRWLIHALAIAALCGATAQPGTALGQRMIEVADATIHRDLVYKTVNGAALLKDGVIVPTQRMYDSAIIELVSEASTSE
jgi:hypothetical protein